MHKMSILKQQFIILRGATDISLQHEVVYYTTFFILDVVFMSEFLSYSVDTFLKELNKIGAKRTMGVLNIYHRPDHMKDRIKVSPIHYHIETDRISNHIP